MSELVDLLADNESVAGRVATTAVIAAVAGLVAATIARLLTRGEDDSYARYYKRKITRYVVAFVALIATAVTWRAFAGQAGVVLGLMAAGVAFAMQEVIGALAGWFNILSGRIFRVGDRIDMGGVRGDVIDITPLRTKLLEIGSEPAAAGARTSWVTARQPTGRVVAVSNKKTFTDPVFNYSARLEWIWEEIAVGVPQGSDWMRAEEIVLDAIREHDPDLRARGEAALAELGQRYLISRAELEPHTFVRVSAGDVEIVGRFITAVRAARGAKDAITRRVLERFRVEGLEVAYTTYGVALSGRSLTGWESTPISADDRGSSARRG